MNINRCAITVYFLFFSFKTIQNIVRKKVFFIWDVIPESVQYFLTIINNYKIFPDILLDIIYRPLSWSCKIYFLYVTQQHKLPGFNFSEISTNFFFCKTFFKRKFNLCENTFLALFACQCS